MARALLLALLLSCSTSGSSSRPTAIADERVLAASAPQVAPVAATPSAATSIAPEPAKAPAAVAAAVAATALATDAGAAASSEQDLDALLALPGSTSTSIGGPSRGRVTGSVALPVSGPGFVHNAKRPLHARYATVELVQAIARAAAVVDRELPGAALVVNDLGLAEGGPIAQHGSHQSGRDADILFYVFDAAGQVIPSVGVPLDPQGKGWDFKDLRVAADDQRVKLDAPRTWRFMQALLEVAPDAVQRIFIAEHLRTLLLRQAEKAKAPQAIRERFADVTCQPGTPHDDHLHLRLYCSPEDIPAGCEDSPPIYPFRSQALSALGLTSVIASAYTSKAERAEKAARTTTPEAARKRAGPMHPAVRRFLAEREKWLKAPHPGRPYCR